MDLKEHSMYLAMEKLKSLGEAIEQFGRLLEAQNAADPPKRSCSTI